MGLGFGTGLRLDNIYSSREEGSRSVIVFNNTIALCVAAALSLDLSAGENSSEEDLNS